MNVSERDAIIAGDDVGNRLIRHFNARFTELRGIPPPFGGVRNAWESADREVTEMLNKAEEDFRRHLFYEKAGVFSERISTFRKTAEDKIKEFKRTLEPMAIRALQAEEEDRVRREQEAQRQAEEQQLQAQLQAQWQATEEQLRTHCQGQEEQLQAEYQGRVEQLHAQCRARGTQLRAEWAEYRGGLERQAQEIINARRRQEQEQARQAQEERARQEQARQEYERQEQERARQEQERPTPPTGAGDRRSILAEELRTYGITDKNSYKKWTVRNHPDKNQAPGQEALFQKVSVLWKEFDDINNPGFNFGMGRKTGRRGMSPKKSPRKTRKSPRKTRKSPKKSPRKTRKSPRKTRKSH